MWEFRRKSKNGLARMASGWRLGKGGARRKLGRFEEMDRNRISFGADFKGEKVRRRRGQCRPLLVGRWTNENEWGLEKVQRNKRRGCWGGKGWWEGSGKGAIQTRKELGGIIILSGKKLRRKNKESSEHSFPWG
jgi:hypothetical protein